MIAKQYITEWTKVAEWQQPKQIEQDLIITKALLDIFGNPELKEKLAFRGGTALNKLFFKTASRYSEDLDLVSIVHEPSGHILDQIRSVLDPWLGNNPQRDRSHQLVKLIYKVVSEDGFPLRVKIEINCEERFSVFGYKEHQFECTSTWIAGKTNVLTYSLEELLSTKLRALFQRRKGRDLFDLYTALITIPSLNVNNLLVSFEKYMQFAGLHISKKMFLENMDLKLQNSQFRSDIIPLLSREKRQSFDLDIAYDYVREVILEKL